MSREVNLQVTANRCFLPVEESIISYDQFSLLLNEPKLNLTEH